MKVQRKWQEHENKIVLEHPCRVAAQMLNLTVDQTRSQRANLLKLRRAPREPLEVSPQGPSDEVLAIHTVKALRHSQLTPIELANSLGIDLERLNKVLDVVQKTHEVDRTGALLRLGRPEPGHIERPFLVGDSEWMTFGLVSDMHIGNRKFRQDALDALYDLFAEEGIQQVFIAGNPVDGYDARKNAAEVVSATPDGQAELFAQAMPARPNLTSYFVTGDDHEGWWIQQGLNYGSFLQMIAEKNGRTDLKYIGHVESDVQLCNVRAGTFTMMKVMHPGGGSTYARSYVAQKLVESFQGGEKPAMCVLGHYHVHGYFIERNCHCVMLPGVCDQTIFARKKRLRFEVGGAIVRLKLDPNGAICRFQLEFKNFFDRGYYQVHLDSDRGTASVALT